MVTEEQAFGARRVSLCVIPLEGSQLEIPPLHNCALSYLSKLASAMDPIPVSYIPYTQSLTHASLIVLDLIGSLDKTCLMADRNLNSIVPEQ